MWFTAFLPLAVSFLDYRQTHTDCFQTSFSNTPLSAIGETNKTVLFQLLSLSKTDSVYYKKSHQKSLKHASCILVDSVPLTSSQITALDHKLHFNLNLMTECTDVTEISDDFYLSRLMTEICSCFKWTIRNPLFWVKEWVCTFQL